MSCGDGPKIASRSDTGMVVASCCTLAALESVGQHGKEANPGLVQLDMPFDTGILDSSQRSLLHQPIILHGRSRLLIGPVPSRRTGTFAFGSPSRFAQLQVQLRINTFVR